MKNTPSLLRAGSIGFRATFVAAAAACALVGMATTASAATTITTGAFNNHVSSAGFNLSLSDSSLTNTPAGALPPSVQLESFSFSTPGGTSGQPPNTAGSLYLSVFSNTTFGSASYLGSSTNAVDMSVVGSYTYAFNNIAVSTTPPVTFFFSSSAAVPTSFSDLTQAIGRFNMNTSNPISTGSLLNPNGTVQSAGWDIAGANFVVAVPEPSTVALAMIFGVGMLFLFRRRRIA